MFERFTERARHVVVLAQEEARLLNHDHIGTEHLLLGLIGEGDGVAARALASLGISLEFVRGQVEELIRPGPSGPSRHIPFTRRAKKVLELALREAIQLGHNYIGTEHVLLGLIREGEGVAAQVLTKAGADFTSVRARVLGLVLGSDAPLSTSPPTHTPAGAMVNSAARALAAGRPVGSDHYLLALADDEQSLAARLLGSVGLDRASLERRLAELDRSGTSDELVEEAGAMRTTLGGSEESIGLRVDDPTLAAAIREALANRDLLGDAPEQGTGGDDPAAWGSPGLWEIVIQTARAISARRGGDPVSLNVEVRSSGRQAGGRGEVQTQSDERDT